MIQARLQISGQINGREKLSGGLNTTIKEIKPELEDVKIKPSTEQQTLKSSKYGYNEIIVEAVTSAIDADIKSDNIKKGTNILGVEGGYEGIDTSDANATAADILKDKTAYVNGEKIVGTYEETVSENTHNATLKDNGETSFSVSKWLTKIESLDILNVDSLYYSFQEWKYLEEVLDLNIPKTTNLNGTFIRCPKLKKVTFKEASNVTNISGIFRECASVKEVSGLETCKNLQNISYAFYSTGKLIKLCKLNCETVNVVLSIFYGWHYYFTDFGGLINLGKAYTKKTAKYSNYTLDLLYCPALTYESLMNVINGLYDLNLTYDVANSGTLYTQSLVLGSTNLEKLTADEIAIATAKGWTVS